jgi:hypothetical protein
LCCRSIDAAKAGLHATLIIRHPQTGKLSVNFDGEILQLIRESRCLQRMSVAVPEQASMVLLQDEKFKSFYDRLMFAQREIERVGQKVIPVVRPMLRPHLDDLERKVQPGMVSLTWQSMNIDGYAPSAGHIGSGPGHACTGTWPGLHWDLATSAPGPGHVCAGTWPRLRQDLATSAPGPGRRYLSRIHQGLVKFEELVNKINDIIDNRVEVNLRPITRVSV